MEENNIINKIKFFKECSKIEHNLSGHSSATRYICEKDNKKYFVKILNENKMISIEFIDKVYKKLEIPTAHVVEKGYIDEVNKTYVVYEFIEGETLKKLTREWKEEKLEEISYSVGKYLSRFEEITCKKEEILSTIIFDNKTLIETLYFMKEYYNKNEKYELAPIDLDRLIKDFLEYKEYVYKTKTRFIHKDINLSNIIVKNNELYLIDTDGGSYGFRALDFRGNCWYGWQGDYIKQEQAVFRGIYKGMFNGDIPEDFYKELAYTMIYEFLLKIREVFKTKDMKGMKEIFDRFYYIFDKTNYFENYKFEWINK